MEDIGPALLLAQNVVARPYVEDNRVLGLRHVGKGEEIVFFQIGDDQLLTGEESLPRLGLEVLVKAQDHLGKTIVLIEEPPRPGVFLERNSRALYALVSNNLVEKRKRRRLDVLPAEIQNIHLQRCRLRRSRCLL